MDIKRGNRANPVGWLTGWKAIMRYVDNYNYKTIMRWTKKYSFPLHRTPENKPTALTYEVDKWLIEYNKQVKKIKRS